MAMDLTVNVKREDCVRTIFEDAEYFSKSHSYKLMPITFETVNETIIHIEHNYCHFVPSSISESNGNLHSGEVIHGEMDERNYKKRKIKTLPLDNNGIGEDYERDTEEPFGNYFSDTKCSDFLSNSKTEEESGISIQPLDLSLPQIQEQKTDKMLKESLSNIPKMKSDVKSNAEVKQFDIHESNKENVTTPSKKIQVTISRPSQKEYYQPCEIFLNDVARISPDLIKNDCYEIDIIDRTHSQNFEKERYRTYYIVSESTWRIFENSTERIILTNDLNIGKPMQNDEKYDKPKYLIFDQYSLTESLAKICENKGGHFEYTCLEESKDGRKDRPCDNFSEITYEREKHSGCPKNRNSNNSGENTEEASNDCNSYLEISSNAETNTSETCNEGSYTDGTKVEKSELHSASETDSKKLPGGILVLEDKNSSQFERFETEKRICDHNSSFVPIRSMELNTTLTDSIPELKIVPGKTIDEVESNLKEEAIEIEGAEEESAKVVNDKTGSGANNCRIVKSKRKGSKRNRVNIRENGCLSSGKKRKLETVEKIRRKSRNINEKEKIEGSPSSSVRVTRSSNVRSLRKEKAETKRCFRNSGNRVLVEKIGKAANEKVNSKSKSERKIGCTKVQTRSAKGLSTLRSGKQRCSPPAKVSTRKKRDDEISTSKLKKEELRRKRRTGITTTRKKSMSKENKRICRRKRT